MRRRVTTGYFEVKCEAFGRRMARVLSTDQCRGFDRDELENVGRIAFLGAMMRFDSQYGADLFTYAFRRIAAAVSTFVRSERRQTRRCVPIEDTQAVFAQGGRMNSQIAIEQRLLVEDIFDHAGLGQRERIVVTRSRGDDCSYRDIGEEIGVSHETVGRILQRALAKIHRRFPNWQAVLA